MLFLGVSHTNDPTNPQLNEIEQAFKTFRPDIVLVEGGPWTFHDTREETVSRLGELAYTRQLAQQAGVAVADADPPYADELRDALSKFSPERVKLFYALRMVPQFKESRSKYTVDERMARHLGGVEYRAIPALGGVITDLPQLQSAVAKELPRLRDWTDIDNSFVAGTSPDSSLNDVARNSFEFRNRYTGELIKAHLGEGKRVMVVEGAAHLDALRQGNLFARPSDAERVRNPKS